MPHRSLAAALVLAIGIAAPAASQTLQPAMRELGPLPDAEIAYLTPSPDGRMIAMTAYSTGEPALWVFSRDTGSSTLLARGRDFHMPAWSPRGDRIAFGHPDESRAYRIYALPVDPRTGRSTGALRRVSTSRGSIPAFSPDGGTIAFASDSTGGGPGGIVLVPASGGAERRIGRGAPVWLTWSGDGWIYYGLPTTPGRPADRIERIRPADGAVEVVVRTVDGAWPGVTPDGSLVAYEAAGGGEDETRTLARVGGGAIGEFRVPADVYGEAWTPSGYRLLGAVVTTPRALEVVRLDGGGRRRLTDGAGLDRRPTWSPDGRLIAYHTRQNGRYVLAIRPAAGGSARIIPTDLEPGIGMMSWSPDGRRLIYRNAGLDRLLVVDVQAGTSTALAQSAFIGLSVWRPDGRSIVYVRRGSRALGPPIDVHEVTLEGVDRRLRRLDAAEFPGLRGVVLDNERMAYAVIDSAGIVAVPLDGGPTRRLVGGPHLRPTTSPDGRWIATPVEPSMGRPTAIDLVPTSGGEPRRLSLGFGLVNSDQNNVRWHPDGRHLITIGLRPGADNAQVFLVPLNGEPARPIADLYFPAEQSHLDLSSDGAAVIYTRASQPTARLIEIDLGGVIPAGAR